MGPLESLIRQLFTTVCGAKIEPRECQEGALLVACRLAQIGSDCYLLNRGEYRIVISPIIVEDGSMVYIQHGIQYGRMGKYGESMVQMTLIVV